MIFSPTPRDLTVWGVDPACNEPPVCLSIKILQLFYSKYGIGFDVYSTFSLLGGGAFGKYVIIFAVDNNSSVHADKRKKDIFFSW